MLVPVAVVGACAIAIATVEPVGRKALGRLGYGPANTRLVTGLVVTGTAERPRLYVASSDPRVGGAASAGSPPGDTNSGVVSELTWDGDSWTRRDVVRGLPRSRSNHATNGLALSRDGRTLYVAQGSNTNKGAPSEEFGNLPEYQLSGAILSVDLSRIDGTYDVPALDGDGPFGGRGGRSQGVLAADGPVDVFAPGFRNTYDVVVTRSGRIYATQNGANGDWGDVPAGEGPDGGCTNEPRPGGTRDDDTLHLVEAGGYGGHPNPTRARTSPRECDYLPPAQRSALATFPSSTNGLAEYTSSNGDAALRGDLVTVSLDGRVSRVGLDEGGARATTRETLATLTAPLDVTTQGDDDVFPGTIWIAQYTARSFEQRFDDDAGAIAILEPTDFERALPWRTLPRTGLARQEVSFVEAGGRLYLAGGDRRQQAYDPAAGRWVDVAPLPERLDHVQGVAIDGRIYYLGGLTGWPGPAVATVDVYDPAADAFSRQAPMERPRGAGGVAVVNGRIYYFGGLSDGEAVPWADVYDPAEDRWTRLPDMPRARDHFHAAVVGNRIYAIGGRDSDIGREIAETDAFDVATGRWVTGLAPIPTRRGGYAAAVLDDEILVIGGETARGALATVEAYRPDDDAWRTLAPMTTARHGIQAALCGGAVYVAAGGVVAGGNAPTDVFEAYFPRDARGCGERHDDAGGAEPGFVVGSLRGVDVSHATTLQFGPDGRLYVGQENGLLHVYGIARRAPGRYDVVSSERIELVQRIANHDDDGGSAVGPRALVRYARDKLGL